MNVTAVFGATDIEVTKCEYAVNMTKRDRLVCRATDCGMDGQGSILGKGKNVFSTPLISHTLCGLPNFPSPAAAY
jgi:hypothetical protein